MTLYSPLGFGTGGDASGSPQGLEGQVSGGNKRLFGVAKDFVSQGITNKASVIKHGLKKGFTLIELLVVTGIIGMLVALTLPALASAKDNARKAVCLNNVHQMGVATINYATNNRDAIPRDSVGANTRLKTLGAGVTDKGRFFKDGYIEDLRSFYCPAKSSNAPQYTESTQSDFLTQDMHIRDNYLLRNGSGMERTPGGVPLVASTLTEYDLRHFSLILDSNYLENNGIVNHLDSGLIQHVSILATDGHGEGFNDPENNSVSGGDRDLIFKWADKKINKTW